MPSQTIALKNEVVNILHCQGYVIENNTFRLPNIDRQKKRGIHIVSRAERINENIKFIESFGQESERYMLNSSDIDVLKIRPTLKEVKCNSIYGNLFRWWNLAWWSLPYEKSYGRQMRFIVWDDYHNAPIGLIGLQSPLLSWSVRDNHLGISKDKRDFWVNQSMSAQRLGALPPYNKFLGGKLVASLMTSNDVRKCFYKKYKDYETLLMKRKIPANLLFITTTGAYGKSSVYNRLRFNKSKICDFIGYTNGSGSFHIPNTLYEGFVRHLKERGIKAGRGFGNGPSAKMKIITQAMDLLGFKNGANHHIKRAVYLFPFADNIKDTIQQGERPNWHRRSTEDITAYWKERWAIKRMGGCPQEKLDFSKERFIAEMNQYLEKCKQTVAKNLP